MLDENLIATLEQSLRQTRNAQNRLLVRLREVESEADRLRQEIEALENSAAQTEQAIYSLLATMRSTGAKSWRLAKNLQIEDTYDDSEENIRMPPPPREFKAPRASNGNQPGAYQNNTVAYFKNNAQSPHHAEPTGNRFTDRTITQACTLLLREAGVPLHVNDLYNMLVAGGMSFTGNNPTISIAVSLNRNRRFRKVAPGTFDLVIRDASQAVS